MFNKQKLNLMSIALRYCISDRGDYCYMCPYQNHGSGCSKQLLRDASDALREIAEKAE